MNKLIRIIATSCLNIFLINTLHAEIVVKNKIKVTSQVSNWVSSFRDTIQVYIEKEIYPETGYTECRETSELDHAYLCLSQTRREMNMMFARVTLYFESSDPSSKGHIVSHDNNDLAYYRSALTGNDLKLSQFLIFHKEVMKKCSETHQDPKYCLSLEEKDMFNSLIFPLVGVAKEAVVITFAQDNRNHMSTAAHEFMHAQYFLNSKYKEAIIGYWNSMKDSERQDVVDILSRYYDKNDSGLMANEFGAYMLQSFNPRNLLYDFLLEHRGPLLKKVGAVAPIIEVK